MLPFAPAPSAIQPFASEANLELPDLSVFSALGMSGRVILALGLIVCVAGLAFGLHSYRQIDAMPVHLVVWNEEAIFEHALNGALESINAV